MISINGITLSDDLVWPNEFNESNSIVSKQYTLGGMPVFETLGLESGQIIELIARKNGNEFSGYFTRSQLQQLQDLKKSSQIVEFIYGSQSFQVIVTSIDVFLVFERPDPLLDSEYTGTIILTKV